jgi:hypothetical protein
VLRWLTRLFRQREAAEAAPAEAPPPPAPPAATIEATASDRIVPIAPNEVVAAEPRTSTTEADLAAGAEPEKEMCPTCGRTSVFAGPPGQRFCTYCALRDELFEASAAASSE